MTNILKVFDLDGTLTPMDTVGTITGKNKECPEIMAYINAASNFVAKQTGLLVEEVFEGLKAAILEEVFPNRAKLKYWGQFPDKEGNLVSVVPAVDHYQLVKQGVLFFLQSKLGGSLDPKIANEIRAFLESDWGYQLFNCSSDASLPHAAIEEDAVRVLDASLRKSDLVAVITNSTVEKARTLLERAGFGSHMLFDRVARRKLGVVGGAKKFQIDGSMFHGNSSPVRLSPYYKENIELDLRRNRFRKTVRGLAHSVDADKLQVFSDIPELDSYPLHGEFGTQVRHGMRVTPDSAPESIAAAQGILHAKAGIRLSMLVEELDGE